MIETQWKTMGTIVGPTHAPHAVASDAITFFVEGRPEPGGSKTSFVPTDKKGNPYRGPTGRIIVNTTDANKNVKHWKIHVAAIARIKFNRKPFDGPIACRFEFILARPQFHFGTGRNAEKVKDSAPHFPTGKPDTLKLSRGTEDALTGICWHDDAQVVNQTATKRYGALEGVRITIEPVTVITPGNREHSFSLSPE